MAKQEVVSKTEYKKLRDKYDRVGAHYEDAAEEKNQVKMKKLKSAMDKIESKIHAYEHKDDKIATGGGVKKFKVGEKMEIYPHSKNKGAFTVEGYDDLGDGKFQYVGRFENDKTEYRFLPNSKDKAYSSGGSMAKGDEIPTEAEKAYIDIMEKWVIGVLKDPRNPRFVITGRKDAHNLAVQEAKKIDPDFDYSRVTGGTFYGKGGGVNVARRGIFSIDSIEGKTFKGYTFGDDWNGFATPYFERDEAYAIATALGGRKVYDKPVYFYFNSDEYEKYDQQKIKTVDGEKVVYPIGAYNWTWEEVGAMATGGGVDTPKKWRDFISYNETRDIPDSLKAKTESELEQMKSDAEKIINNRMQGEDRRRNSRVLVSNIDKILDAYKKANEYNSGSMGTGGGVGSFEYKTIDTRTEKGLKEAEKLQSQGWKMINGNWDRMQFERPKTKKEEGGSMATGGGIPAWRGRGYKGKKGEHFVIEERGIETGDVATWYLINAKTVDLLDMYFDTKQDAQKYAKQKGFIIVKEYEDVDVNSMSTGGGVSSDKTWIVNIGMPNQKRGTTDLRKEEIVLGRMSDEFDVQQAIKRKGEDWMGNGKVLSIVQKHASGGLIKKSGISWIITGDLI